MQYKIKDPEAATVAVATMPINQSGQKR